MKISNKLEIKTFVVEFGENRRELGSSEQGDSGRDTAYSVCFVRCFFPYSLGVIAESVDEIITL